MMKKGLIYITVVIIFLVVMLSVFYTYEVYNSDSKKDTVETRIKTMDNFIGNLRDDAQRSAYTAGYRTLIALEEYVLEQGSFLDDLEESFKEPFYNGTIGNYSPDILSGQSFSDFLKGVNFQSRKIDININITVLDINIYHSDPWNIIVEILSTVNLSDNKGLAEWYYNETFISKIPIEKLRDPLYSVNTLGKLQSFVVATNISDFVSFDNKTTNLSVHLNNLFYKASDKAPSFIMRFEGNLSNSTYGIESFVDISLLEKQEDLIIDYDKSVVDYIYFGSQSTNNKCNFPDMPSWFKLDENHLSDYELEDVSYTSC